MSAAEGDVAGHEVGPADANRHIPCTASIDQHVDRVYRYLAVEIEDSVSVLIDLGDLYAVPSEVSQQAGAVAREVVCAPLINYAVTVGVASDCFGDLLEFLPGPVSFLP